MNIIRRLVSFTTQTLNPQRWLAAAKRKAVRVEVLAIGLLLMPVILVMAYQLPFVDVPIGAFYRTAVSAVYDARITTGTTPTTFSPEDFVTRGQMAVFLHRGLGRITYDDTAPVVNLGTDTVDLAVITLRTGGTPGGTGFVKFDGVVNSHTQSDSTTGCPCRLWFYIQKDGGGVTSSLNYMNLYDGEGGVPGTVNGAVTWAVSVPTGTLLSFRLKAVFGESVGPLPANWTKGALTAIYAPFGQYGGNTLNAASASPDDAPQGTEPDARPDAEQPSAQ